MLQVKFNLTSQKNLEAKIKILILSIIYTMGCQHQRSGFEESEKCCVLANAVQTRRDSACFCFIYQIVKDRFAQWHSYTRKMRKIKGVTRRRD
jgi:hypothetical protein